MGSSLTKKSAENSGAPVWNPDEWRILKEMPFCTVLKNQKTGQQLEKYIINQPEETSEYQINYKFLEARRGAHVEIMAPRNPYWVRVVAHFKSEASGFCQGSKLYYVITERVKRIAEVNSWEPIFNQHSKKTATSLGAPNRLVQALRILKNLLVGFQGLYDIFGGFQVLENMIGFSLGGEARVWVNQNFGLNQIESYYESARFREGISPQEMCRSVYQILAKHMQISEFAQLRLFENNNIKNNQHYHSVNIIGNKGSNNTAASDIVQELEKHKNQPFSFKQALRRVELQISYAIKANMRGNFGFPVHQQAESKKETSPIKKDSLIQNRNERTTLNQKSQDQQHLKNEMSYSLNRKSYLPKSEQPQVGPEIQQKATKKSLISRENHTMPAPQLLQQHSNISQLEAPVRSMIEPNSKGFNGINNKNYMYPFVNPQILAPQKIAYAGGSTTSSIIGQNKIVFSYMPTQNQNYRQSNNNILNQTDYTTQKLRQPNKELTQTEIQHSAVQKAQPTPHIVVTQLPSSTNIPELQLKPIPILDNLIQTPTTTSVPRRPRHSLLNNHTTTLDNISKLSIIENHSQKLIDHELDPSEHCLSLQKAKSAKNCFDSHRLGARQAAATKDKFQDSHTVTTTAIQESEYDQHQRSPKNCLLNFSGFHHQLKSSTHVFETAPAIPAKNQHRQPYFSIEDRIQKHQKMLLLENPIASIHLNKSKHSNIASPEDQLPTQKQQKFLTLKATYNNHHRQSYENVSSRRNSNESSNTNNRVLSPKRRASKEYSVASNSQRNYGAIAHIDSIMMDDVISQQSMRASMEFERSHKKSSRVLVMESTILRS